MKMGLIRKLSLLAVVSVALGCLPAWGQTITGDIGGTVTDPTGAVVAGAKVTATNTATNVATSTATDKEGIYSIRFLQVGQYKVAVTLKGFNTVSTAAFHLEVGQVAKVDARLTPGS